MSGCEGCVVRARIAGVPVPKHEHLLGPGDVIVERELPRWLATLIVGVSFILFNAALAGVGLLIVGPQL